MAGILSLNFSRIAYGWRERCRCLCLGGLATLASVTLGGTALAGTVRDLLDSNKQLGMFSAALQRTPLWSRIQQEQSVTLFVPSDQALRNEGAAFLLDQVLIAEANRERLQEVLSYHVYVGPHLAPEEIGHRDMASVRGACFGLSRSGSALRIGPEAVVTDYIGAENGGIYVIDRLLWQPWSGSRKCSDAGQKPARMSARGPAPAPAVPAN